MNVPLACTVRGCGEPLTRHTGAWTCPRGHSYDVARRGYVNLLQPQDRRSAQPGDARPAVDARAALEQAGIGAALIRATTQIVAELALENGAAVVDLGSGTGRALATIAAERPLATVGIDLSVPAIAHAARHWPGPTWVVANADRRLPLVAGSVDVVLSLNGRRNPDEVTRVLRPGGSFIAAVPAPDDLREVREAMLGTSTARDRTGVVVAAHADGFMLAGQRRVTDRVNLDRQGVRALLQATYRGARRREAARIDELDGIDVTLASDLLVFRPRL